MNAIRVFVIVNSSRSTGRQVDKSVLIICINGCVGIGQAEIRGLNECLKKQPIWLFIWLFIHKNHHIPEV